MKNAFDPGLDLPKTKVTLKYLILSQPRSGSTMITSALRNSGKAGVPIEYFNPNNIKMLKKPITKDVLASYYLDVVDRRTSDNGVFGMKIHLSQFRSLFMKDDGVSSDGIDFLYSFDKLIVTSRRDKIAQAISHLLAHRQKIWNSSSQDDAGRHNLSFNRTDVPEILQRLNVLVLEEISWDKICSTLALHPLNVVYEDLSRSPHFELGKILDYLGLPLMNISPGTVKLSSNNHSESKIAFLKTLGVDCGS